MQGAVCSFLKPQGLSSVAYRERIKQKCVKKSRIID